MDGDIVTIHYICRDEAGDVVDDSANSEEPVSFEVGAGEVTGNPLFQAFDEAIRGLPLGSTTILEAKGGEWKRELFFEVCPLRKLCKPALLSAAAERHLPSSQKSCKPDM